MKFRILFLFLLLFGIALLLWAEARFLSDGFKLSHIQSPISFRQKEENFSQDNVSSILSQPFYYLDKGSQCYVFESEDKQYILKFFRFPHYRTLMLSHYFPLPSFLREMESKKAEKKRSELSTLFNSCKLAFDNLKEESGLIYLHLNRTKNLKNLQIYDKLGRSFVLEIDHYPFVLQKKAEPIYAYLFKAIQNGKKEEAKIALSSLVSLLYCRLDKGIYDHDASLAKNAGCCYGQAQFLDIGSFEKIDIYQNRILRRMEIVKVTHKLESWLHEKDPQLAAFFRQELETGF